MHSLCRHIAPHLVTPMPQVELKHLKEVRQWPGRNGAHLYGLAFSWIFPHFCFKHMKLDLKKIKVNLTKKTKNVPVHLIADVVSQVHSRSYGRLVGGVVKSKG